MKFQSVVLLCFLVAFATSVNGAALDEDFGYVDVRPGAHMFWVVYHTELPGDWTQYPLIMWLQGGPGASGVGYGNFEELGPYDINGNLRDGRWTKKANVLFVDNPVGSGYSYVDDTSLLCQNNTQIADDLVTLITSVFTDYPAMQVMPFFVYAESYGGKMTADFAIAFEAARANGDVVSNFQGIALGDSWISPMDSVNTWGPFLYSMGFVNAEGQAAIDSSAANTQAAVDVGNWEMATTRWSITEQVVLRETNGVNFYNVLAENDIYDSQLSSSKKFTFLTPEIQRLYDLHVRPMPLDALSDFMDGPQAAHWNIPPTVTWGGQSGNVFSALQGDFMKPVIDSVAYLLANSNIHVSVYTGDLDLICDTPGTYLWIENMDYPQKTNFEATSRVPLYVPIYSSNAAYVQRSERFSVFTILRSGHMVPIDAPEMCLQMIDMITGYGAEAVAPKQPHVAVLHHNKAHLKHPETHKSEETKVEMVKTPEVKVEHKPEAHVVKEEHKPVAHAVKEEHKPAASAPKEEHKSVVHAHKQEHKKPVAAHKAKQVEQHPRKVEAEEVKQPEAEEVKEEVANMIKAILQDPSKPKPSPKELELKAKIAQSHSKATPAGRELDTGNVFNRKNPSIGIRGARK